MDTVTLIGLIGSIVSIVSFLISLFMQSSKNTMSINNGTTSNNLNINNSFNSNSFNTTNNTINETTSITIYETPSNSTSEKDVYILIAVLFASFFVIKFYLKHQVQIIPKLLLIILICNVINAIIIYLICNKSRNLSKCYLFNKIIINWMSIFLVLPFINKPVYSSLTLENTKNLLEQAPNIISYIMLFFTHTYDSVFILLQIFGLLYILYFAIYSIYTVSKDFFNLTKTSTIKYEKPYKDISLYIFNCIFTFILIRGLLPYFLIKISSLQKPL